MIKGITGRVTRIYQRNVSVIGHVDRLVDGILHGWALSPKTPSNPVLVQCRLGDKVLDPVLALGERPDVAAANYGTAVCGFAIDVKPLLASQSLGEGQGAKLDVFAGYENFKKIGSFSLSPWFIDFSVYDDIDPKKAQALAPICLEMLTRADTEFRKQERELPYLSLLRAAGPCRVNDLGPSVAPVVAPTTVPETLKLSQGKELILSNYVDQQRYRFAVNRSFRVELSDEQTNAYLGWYLRTYGVRRRWRRAPLSRQEIEYLNSDGAFAGATIAMSLFLPESMTHGSRDLETIKNELAYWWAVDQASALSVEDCLIPDWCVESLRKSRAQLQGVAFKLSHFMERYFREHPELSFLDLTSAADRMLYYFYFLIKAAERPDLLRLLPPKDLNRLLRFDAHNKAGSEQFRATAEEIFRALGIGDAAAFSKLLYEMIAGRLFDLETMSFATVSTDGHRVLSAGLPLPSGAVDVQVIGAFQKTSGLGQAARLSAAMIKRAGLKVSTFNFDLDNPAPEGYSSSVATEDLKNARINILHLNGESAQLAFAYMPNIFEKSYNIGYFYWELDTPATCHHLSVELLDEIWVSSEYCREIYASVTQKPVINVGMCVENLLGSNVEAARTFVQRKLSFSSETFIFLAAFDSFSFVQRKNPLGVIRAFRAAFADDPKMRLVLKTHNRASIQDAQQLKIWAAVDDELAEDDRIVLLDETLTYSDLQKLKRGVDCYVSLHRSEGWGFGMIEAMASGIPVVATAYSGNMDFCSPDTAWLVDYELTTLYPDDYIFVAPGQRWAEPKLASAVEQMRSVAYDSEKREGRAKYASEFVRANFSEEAIARRYKARLEQLGADLSCEQIEELRRRSRKSAAANAERVGAEADFRQ